MVWYGKTRMVVVSRRWNGKKVLGYVYSLSRFDTTPARDEQIGILRLCRASRGKNLD